MKVRNFFLIISLLGMFAQSPLPGQKSMYVALFASNSKIG
jgi:hypothetical protein